jgi:hypothetical protein
MDVEEMRKKAKLAITPAMLKKSKGVSSIIKLTPWYTRRHMANEDKCSCHVVSYTNPRLHPLKKAIIGIKFKVHRKYTQSKRWGRVPVKFTWKDDTGTPLTKFFQAWGESLIKGYDGVIDLVVEPGIDASKKFNNDGEPEMKSTNKPPVELSNALIDVLKKQAEDMRVKTNFNIDMLVQINKQ